MKSYKVILIIVFQLFLVIMISCSSNPSEGDGKNILENLINNSTAKNYLKLISFHKINAQETEIYGTKTYSLLYEVEFEFLQDASYYGNIDPLYVGEPNYFYGPNVKKGETKKVRGAISFTKTENGWQGPDGEIY